MLGLNDGSDRSDCRCYRAFYRLLDRIIYDLKVSNDFFKANNCFVELVCVCEPRDIVKISEGGFCCFCLFLGTSKRRRFFSLVATTRSMSSWKNESMLEVFLLLVSCWNLWMAWARLSASAERERKTIIYKVLCFLFKGEIDKKKRKKNLLYAK